MYYVIAALLAACIVGFVYWRLSKTNMEVGPDVEREIPDELIDDYIVRLHPVEVK